MPTRRDVFQAIADPTRRDILGLITGKSLTLNAVADNFDISRPAISRHVKILIECGLIVIKKEGRERFCTARPAKLREVDKWLNYYRSFWMTKLDDLDSYLSGKKA